MLLFHDHSIKPKPNWEDELHNRWSFRSNSVNCMLKLGELHGVILVKFDLQQMFFQRIKLGN